MLKGRLLLRIAGRGDLAVGPDTGPAVFPGDVATFGGVVEGPVHDLNLMARRGVVRPRLERVVVEGAYVLPASPAHRLVIPIDGRLLCEPTAPSTASRSPFPMDGGGSGASTPQTSPARGGGGPRSGGGGGDAAAELGPLDALWLDPNDLGLTLRAIGATVYVATFAP